MGALSWQRAEESAPLLKKKKKTKKKKKVELAVTPKIVWNRDGGKKKKGGQEERLRKERKAWRWRDGRKGWMDVAVETASDAKQVSGGFTAVGHLHLHNTGQSEARKRTWTRLSNVWESQTSAQWFMNKTVKGNRNKLKLNEKPRQTLLAWKKEVKNNCKGTEGS